MSLTDRTSMGLTLAREEVIELTGRVRHVGQRQALTAMGIAYRIRPDGSPAVLRTVAELILRLYALIRVLDATG